MCAGCKSQQGITALSVDVDATTLDVNITISGQNTLCKAEPYKYDTASARLDLTDTGSTDCVTKLDKAQGVPAPITTYQAAKNTLSVTIGPETIELPYCGGADAGGAGKSALVGFIGVAIAAVGFGSNFIVIKKDEWDPKDGMFFQFNMCIGVFVTGMLYTYTLRGAPPLQPFAMLGGAMWAIGNASCPFIIRTIGMGLGLSIWGTANMLTGWSSAHFGILWVTAQPVAHPGLNALGAAVAVVAILVYAQVKNKDPSEQTSNAPIASWRQARKSYDDVLLAGSIQDSGGGGGSGSKLVGIAVSIVAGILFGACFNPPQHAQDQAGLLHCNAITTHDACLAGHFMEGGTDPADDRLYCSWNAGAAASPACKQCQGSSSCKGTDAESLACSPCGGMPTTDLAFSQFCGILFASFAIMVLYGFYLQFIADEGPIYINTGLVVPGFASGAIWACAQIGWFYANDNLSMVVSFPVITTVPAIIGNLWGYFAFNELRTDSKNTLTLCFGICCSIAAAVIIALSKYD